MMKRVVCVVLALLLCCGCIACTASGTTAGSSSVPEVKIGMFGTTTADVAVQPRFDNAIAYVEAIGGTVVNAEVENGDYVSALNDLIAADVNGVIFESVDEASLAVYIQTCEENKIYFACTDTNIPVEGEIGELIKNSNYYLGCLGKSEVQNGYDTVSMLGKAGAKNIGFCSIPVIYSMGADRDEGFKKAMTEYGMTQLTDFEDINSLFTPAGGADVAQSFLTAYPEMDGIVIGGCTQYCLSGVVQAVENSERDVKVVGIDYDENILDHMQKGFVVGFTGGNWNDDVLAAVLVANAIQGHRLTEEVVNMTTGYFVVDSVEDCESFMKVCNDGETLIYSEEQFKSMNVELNPDFTFAELEAINAAYSLESILANRG